MLKQFMQEKSLSGKISIIWSTSKVLVQKNPGVVVVILAILSLSFLLRNIFLVTIVLAISAFLYFKFLRRS